LNSYDNVPVNYGSTLTNISTATAGFTTYQNIINFTSHSNFLGYTYNRFSTPLSNNRILLFLSALSFQGTSDTSGPLNPLSFVVSTSILSA
jgi:hypothetical protein